MHALEFTAQRGRRQLEQVACDLQAGRGDHLHSSGGEALEQCRENRGTRSRRHASVYLGRHRVRAAARELLFEEWPAVAALDDQYATASRMFETRVPEQAF